MEFEKNALCALEIAFMQKFRCFCLALNEKNEALIAVCENTLDSHANSNVRAFSLEKKFAKVAYKNLSDFEVHFTRALKMARFFELCENLSKKLALLQNNTSQNATKDSKEVCLLLDFILQTCIEEKSSDIHFEQNASNAIIRARCDGILHKVFSLESPLFNALSARLKLECALDMTQRRKALDGRFSKKFDKKEYDFRLSSLPTLQGESLVLRILEQNLQITSLESLGFCKNALQLITPSLCKNSGVILLVGPTGCGKSTTLHAMLESLKSESKKIITIEDPIEYQLDFSTQVLLNRDYNFGFKDALRACLRQDPDVMMIGEIRDEQTLELALQAALTGHLVLATLHANDTRGAMKRILGLGGKMEVLDSALSLIIAQRLVRKLCARCKEEISSTFYESSALYAEFVAHLGVRKMHRQKGCAYCKNLGFSGRTILYEILPHAPSYEMKECAGAIFDKEHSMKRLLQEGISSVEELYRIWG